MFVCVYVCMDSHKIKQSLQQFDIDVASAHVYCSFMQNARFVSLLLNLKDIKSEKQKCAGKLQKNQTNDRITQVKPNEIVYQAR